MIKEIALEDRFQEVLKEAALKVMEAGTGMNLDFARDIFTAARMLKEGYPLKEVLKELKKLFMKRTGKLLHGRWNMQAHIRRSGLPGAR